jgi:hypothetical protein
MRHNKWYNYFFKNVLSNHSKIAKVFEKEVNNPWREELEKQLAKRNLIFLVL